MLKPSCSTLCVLTVLISCCCISNQLNAQPSELSPTKVTFDHHVHVLSPQLLADWKSMGMSFSREDEQYTDPQVVLDCVGAKRMVALSMAHLYSAEWFLRNDDFKENEKEFVQRENNFVASIAKKHPEQVVGFFSINPRSEFAVEELKRCAQIKSLTGLKLHLPANGIDLNEPEHVDKLKDMLAYCNENNLPILMHLDDGSGNFGDRQAYDFWEKIIDPYDDLNLVIAHLGTSGGFNRASDSLLNAFGKLRNDDKISCADNVYFDLSGAVLLEEVDGMSPTNQEMCDELAKQMREIGLDRFLPASDYPALPPDALGIILEDKLKLTADEIREIQSNVAAFLK